MSYSINFTDNVNKEGLIINDNVVNTATSLEFPGRNQKGYAVTIAENFLHLLENFAKNTPPANPIEGQLWYDSSIGVETLMIYNGSGWKSSGSLKKGTTIPSNNVVGDLWVDTTNQQLKLFNGAGWILVGPTFSSGLRTGAVAEKIKDQTINQTEHVVLINYVDDAVVSIQSDTPFTPQAGIPGFDTIKVGINLNSNSSYKVWGTSEKAENLIIGNNAVPAIKFLRSDTSNTTFYGFTIKNDLGLSLGNEQQFQAKILSNRGVIYHSTPNTGMDFRISLGSSTPNETTILSLDSTTGSVLIGAGNTYNSSTLSVNGSGRFTGAVNITDTTQTVNSATGSLIVQGGSVIKKNLIVGGELTVANKMTSSNIIPATNDTSDIGYEDLNTPSNNKKYRTVYATKFKGNLEAESITGTLTGAVVGTATRLASSTVIKIAGDISDATGISFDGDGTSKTFTTTISPNFITSKTSLTDTLDIDQILIYRPYVPAGITPGIYKTTKAKLTSNLSLVPVGTILPFAGSSIPYGYLLCDGSEKQQGVYNDLFNVIQFIYGPINQLTGTNTFKLPDLRGRFPLGLDNMGGSNAMRVDSDTASNLGNASGFNKVTLSTAQVPEHTHSLEGNNGGKFYAINSLSTPPADTNATIGNGLSTTTQGQRISSTGGINENTNNTVPVNVMNPYLSINYIIYAGVINE